MPIDRFLGLARSNRRKLVSYEISLLTIAERLPFELMRTGMWWVWQSSRTMDGRPRSDPSLPDERAPTLLTEDSASAFAREFAEQDDEFRRWILIVGGNDTARAVVDPEQLKRELKAFSEFRDNCLSAVIYQTCDMSYDEFVVDSVVPPAAQELLQVLSDDLGTTPKRLITSSGESVLKRILRGLDEGTTDASSS
jgi:hypothetical protein